MISKQELMDRVSPNVFVGPANLNVHISALRRTLRDGRGGNRFIINIPGVADMFVASVTAASHQKTICDSWLRNAGAWRKPRLFQNARAKCRVG